MPQEKKKEEFYTKLTNLFNSIPGEKINQYYGKNISDILPDIFLNAQKIPTTYSPEEIGVTGRYSVKNKNVNIDSNVDDLIELFTNSTVKDRRVAGEDFKQEKIAAVPHEAAHAIWYNDLKGIKTAPNNISSTTRWGISQKRFDDDRAKLSWDVIHDTYLRNNKSLGNYQYSEEPSHSFADAYALFATNPERLKNHFPEIYDYMKILSGFEYKRPK